MRQKFITLNNLNPKIEVPDSNDPDALERMYLEAVRTHHYTRTPVSWFFYIGVGYFLFQMLCEYFGFKLPKKFVSHQLRILSYYGDIIKQLGDPGGISIGSNWSPWVKLTVVIIVQTIVFVAAYKILGSEDAATSCQEAIASFGFLTGNKSNPDPGASVAADNAGGLFSQIKEIMGGGGGFMGAIKSVLSGMTGPDDDDDIDMDDIPAPKGEATSRVANPFSED